MVDAQALVLKGGDGFKRVCLQTGQCTDAQEEFALVLGERERRRARHLIQEYILWPHPLDALSAQVLAHVALHLWDVAQARASQKTA